MAVQWEKLVDVNNYPSKQFYEIFDEFYYFINCTYLDFA